MSYVIYYRRWGGIDARDEFASLEGLKFVIMHEKDSSFEYFNLCVICDDGSEEIICSNVDKVKDLK